MRPSFGILVATLALTVAPLSAQDAGSVELGLFGRMSSFDATNPITRVPALGLGGRVGLFVLPHLELEASGSYADTHLSGSAADINYMPFRGLIVLNLPVSDFFVPTLGAGVSHSRYTGAISASNTGPSAILGFKAYQGGRTMVRTEATLDRYDTPFNWPQGVDRHLNWGWQLGVSFSTGRPASDSDEDGVRDNRDQCAMTTSGERVDEYGCPLDSDSDGVTDAQDQCAGTPRGTLVDRVGCPRDADADGVPDSRDGCSNTAAGTKVDAKGCPADSDGDGVPNTRDRCSSTPTGVRVYSSGCPVDEDQDGVPDHLDRCSNTTSGARVDGRGCLTDSDRDGVPDGIDRCANSALGSKVDVRGCAVLFEEKGKKDAVLVLEGVTFELGSADLTAPAMEVLDIVAQSLAANPGVRVEVGGHTDNTGPRGLNVELSQARADAVLAYLIAQGASEGALDAKGYGPDAPAATNDSDAGRQMNRRVELRRIN